MSSIVIGQLPLPLPLPPHGRRYGCDVELLLSNDAQQPLSDLDRLRGLIEEGASAEEIYDAYSVLEWQDSDVAWSDLRLAIYSGKIAQGDDSRLRELVGMPVSLAS